ncbi:putative transcriptional regulator [Gottschalkia purinilytica]|uniref:Putative transcriptional regulator n=1 Tax=Gottschalkia purinilytica TaxID=1503 RepID=A0A0L0W951_GOTPU|nr:GntR family transcriptional regulator [Gottschalkia purinilytica]KNF07962.1 putative transcriptional regulator [Gottschalkia purinilytica]
MKPTLNTDKSIYVQIAENIENDILNENLKEDDQVPSTNQFANFYKINPATAAKGINILVDEEVIYKKRGIGMFVSKGAKEKILKKRQQIFFDETIPEILMEAKRLEITPSELVEAINKYKEG